MNVLGVIPARGGSKGIPRKNIKLFNGKPLIYYTIIESKKSEMIDELIVSTEDKEIAKIAKEYGAKVPFLRPDELAGDTIGDFQVLQHVYNVYIKNGWKVSLIIYLRPTNIFRTFKDIDNAIKRLSESNFHSIRSISKSRFSPYLMKRIIGGHLISFIETSYENSRRQDLPITYQINGAIDIIKTKYTLEKNILYGNKITYYLMDEITTIDIDTCLDFNIAEYLYPKWQRGEI